MTTQGAVASTAKTTSIFALMAAIDLATRTPLDLDTLDPSDAVIGTLSDELQRLAYLVVDLEKEAEAIDQEGRAAARAHNQLHRDEINGGAALPQSVCDEHHQALATLASRFRVARDVAKEAENVFWGAVHFEYPEFDSQHFGIREGFVLIANEKTGTPAELPGGMGIQRISLGELLSMLPGGAMAEA